MGKALADIGEFEHSDGHYLGVMSGNTSRRYPPELKQRAVRMVGEIRGDCESDWEAMSQAAEPLGVGTPETVRKWAALA